MAMETAATKIYNAALQNGMPAALAALITAQSKHESDNYRSPVFIKNNNLFGYKWRGQKNATQGTPAPAGEGNNMFYAHYETVADSVKELTDWIKRRQKEGKFPDDLEIIVAPEFYAWLLRSAGYYGAPLKVYIAGLKRYLVVDTQNPIV